MQVRRWLRKGVLGSLLVLPMLVGGERAWAASTGALQVERGVLTVDGLTARTGVELHIAHLRYLYLGLPGAGTALVAERPFAGAEMQRGAFRGDTLTVTAGGSRVQLSSARRLRGTRPVYVRFEPGAGPRSGRPEVSFGDAALVPAGWGGPAPARHYAVRRVKMRGLRSLRTAKLCRPSSKGPEKCALVREVVFKGTGRK